MNAPSLRSLLRKPRVKSLQIKPWTTRKILPQIYSDIEDFATHEKDVINFSNEKYDLVLYFVARKFVNNGKFGLTASLEIKRKEDKKWLWWLDLRQFQHAYYKKNRDYMVIGRYEQYEGSALQKEWQEVLVPFLNLLTDTNKMDQILEGKPFQIRERTIKLDRFFDRSLE